MMNIAQITLAFIPTKSFRLDGAGEAFVDDKVDRFWKLCFK